MKTGRDANQPGQYSSECRLAEVSLIKGQMFPRYPACNALTVWDYETEAGQQVRHQVRSSQTVNAINLFPREFSIRPHGLVY